MFLSGQMGCIQPPKVTVVEPEAGFSTQSEENVVLSFVEGTAPINKTTFSAFLNDMNISSFFSVDEQGANAAIALVDGANMFNFSVEGTDAGKGEAFTCVYKPTSEDPPISGGEINILTNAQFDAQIYESMNAPNALQNYVDNYGVSAHSFSEPVQALVEAEGHSFLLYTATLAKPQGNSQGELASVAANPNERITFVQVILPISVTHGMYPRDFTFLIIQNDIDQYVIIDNGEGTSFRIDYINPLDSATWTVQWFWNGQPVDPQGITLMGLSFDCGLAIGGALFATIAATTISITAPGVGWGLGVWLIGKGLATYSIFSACNCNMGTYVRCN